MILEKTDAEYIGRRFIDYMSNYNLDPGTATLINYDEDAESGNLSVQIKNECGTSPASVLPIQVSPQKKPTLINKPLTNWLTVM